MFAEYLKAGLPLIAVEYRDPINVGAVIKHMVEMTTPPGQPSRPVKKFVTGKASDVEKDTVYWRLAEEQTSGRTAAAMYQTFVQKNSQLIYVNLPNPPRAYASAGHIPTPSALVRDSLLAIPAFKGKTEFVNGLLPALGGLTLQEVVEVVRVAQVRYGKINAARLAKTRGVVMPSIDGLSLVDTTMPFYQPNAELSEFIDRERWFFFNATDPRLRPKGALFGGEPGTGKTQAAKHLAAEWGVPLYRMDATMNSKWHGESEQNLARILEQAANEAPCVLLLDEAEKLFGTSAYDNGIRAKLLSLMLWFMQERSEQVFMILTTNNSDVIPPELLREGRLDRKFVFEGLLKEDAVDFMMNVAASFNDADKLSKDGLKMALTSRLQSLYQAGGDRVSHAALATATQGVIKSTLVQQAQSKPKTGGVVFLSDMEGASK